MTKLAGIFLMLTVAIAPTAYASSRSPQAMQDFWQKHQSQLSSDPQLRQQFDQLCQQKDCDLSRLYWHTDLEEAKALAQRTNKPILSLRLLGRLSEDFSCANSRFFRTVLYPDPAIAQFLRDNYILHWQSERPAPRLTIDFGDGRRIERTLTGNSIHYILDSRGNPIEALPGLYSPTEFLAQINLAKALSEQLNSLPPAQTQAFLQNYHRQRLNTLTQNWNAELRRLGVASQPLIRNSSNPEARPSAIDAGRLALTKAMTEMPTLERTSLPQPSIASPNPLDRLSAENWANMASRNPVRLNAQSLVLMRRLLPQMDSASFARMVDNFTRAIAMDSLRNEYLLHAQIHSWFANASNPTTLTSLNRRVYAELFLTPASDPWLGLLPQDIYTGLPNG